MEDLEPWTLMDAKKPVAAVLPPAVIVRQKALYPPLNKASVIATGLVRRQTQLEAWIVSRTAIPGRVDIDHNSDGQIDRRVRLGKGRSVRLQPGTTFRVVATPSTPGVFRLWTRGIDAAGRTVQWFRPLAFRVVKPPVQPDVTLIYVSGEGPFETVQVDAGAQGVLIKQDRISAYQARLTGAAMVTELTYGFTGDPLVSQVTLKADLNADNVYETVLGTAPVTSGTVRFTVNQQVVPNTSGLLLGLFGDLKDQEGTTVVNLTGGTVRDRQGHPIPAANITHEQVPVVVKTKAPVPATQLGLQLEADKNFVFQGGQVTFTVTSSYHGPTTSILVSMDVPLGLEIIQINDAGNVEIVGRTVKVRYPVMINGQVSTFQVVLQAVTPGSYQLKAIAQADTPGSTPVETPNRQVIVASL